MDALPPEDTVRKASDGNVEAQLVLARRCDAKGDAAEALAWLRRAASTGNGEAMVALGRRLVSKPPYDVMEGIRWTREAAKGGHAEAFHLLSIITAEGLGTSQDWRGAFDLLVHAAALGHRLAQAELAALSHRWELAHALARGDSASENWQRLRDRANLEFWLDAPAARTVSAAPRIAAADDFLSAQACDWLIARARPRLKPAEIFDARTGRPRVASQRTNSGALVEVAEMDMVHVLLRARIVSFTKLSIPGFEDGNVLHYAPGEQYLPHFDFLTAPAMAQEIASGGQRVATFLVYLNDEYEGGETDFPTARLRHKGRKGGALFFWNVTAQGLPDRTTLHAGLAPAAGEKWLYSQWIRARAV